MHAHQPGAWWLVACGSGAEIHNKHSANHKQGRLLQWEPTFSCCIFCWHSTTGCILKYNNWCTLWLCHNHTLQRLLLCDIDSLWRQEKDDHLWPIHLASKKINPQHFYFRWSSGWFLHKMWQQFQFIWYWVIWSNNITTLLLSANSTWCRRNQNISFSQWCCRKICVSQFPHHKDRNSQHVWSWSVW